MPPFSCPISAARIGRIRGRGVTYRQGYRIRLRAGGGGRRYGLREGKRTVSSTLSLHPPRGAARRRGGGACRLHQRVGPAPQGYPPGLPEASRQMESGGDERDLAASSPALQGRIQARGLEAAGHGKYALLKTYEICKWSGALGPKIKEGDRQAPEGFYTVTPAQMNPNSSYYLSFNIGYPNAYDRAYGRTGTHIMVHGACSSAGCYSMSDEDAGELFALARDAFKGGQRQFQIQAFPFRMTPENIARHRGDPNMDVLDDRSRRATTTSRSPPGAAESRSATSATSSTPTPAASPSTRRAACPAYSFRSGSPPPSPTGRPPTTRRSRASPARWSATPTSSPPRSRRSPTS